MQSTLPSGAANVVDPDGANDSTSRLALAGGASNLDQNFGYTLPAAASPPSVPLPFTGASMAGRAAVLGMMLLVTGLALAVGARRNGVLSALLARRRAAGAI